MHPLTVDGDKPLISAWTNNKIKLAMKEDKILALKAEMKPAVNKIEDKIEADLEQCMLPSRQQRDPIGKKVQESLASCERLVPLEKKRWGSVYARKKMKKDKQEPVVGLSFHPNGVLPE